MRIILLTILFLGPLYYFNQEETPAVVPAAVSIDSIRLKMGAPDRIEPRPTQIDQNRVPQAQETTPLAPETSSIGQEQESDQDLVEDVQLSDLEEGWSQELKAMLLRLEPLDGADIHTAYFGQQASYQAELDSLLNEKEQKTTDDAVMEIDYLINHLEETHQNKIKEILGAHYEAVRDHYEDFMDAAYADE
jgi:hypothetical protein